MGFVKSGDKFVKDLTGKNIVVYDLEIKVPIAECGGWTDYKGMGISVGVAFDYREMRYRVFMDDNMQELVDRLNEPDTLVVAFNHISFDNKLLRGNGFDLKMELNNYDMLEISRFGVFGNQRRMKGFKLDEHLHAMDLPVKTGDGANAPIWWQQGLVGKVIDYCLNDVRVEKKLFETIWQTGKMACGHMPTPYDVKRPMIGEMHG